MARRGLIVVVVLAGCAAPVSQAPDRSPPPGTPAAIAIAAAAPTGERGWYCGDRCGRNRSACERASSARYPGDLEGHHRRLAAPGCRPADVAYCAGYEFTLGDVTTARVTLSSTPAQTSDRTPRHVRECLPSAERCAETAAQRARHGYRVVESCGPST